MSRAWLSVLLILTLSGCTLTGAPSHQVTRYYDLGNVEASGAACEIPATLGRVRSSSALQGTRMWYRHTAEPFEPIPYAVSRWSSSPSQWVRQASAALLVRGSADARLMLNLELLTLELVLNERDEAHATLTIAASLSRGQYIQAQREFSLTAAAEASPAGLAATASRLLASWRNELCAWADDAAVADM